MDTALDKTITAIRPVAAARRAAVQAHLDDLTKPRGSLGRLEEIAVAYCLATDTERPVLKQKKIFCLAADHGVAAEGVSAFPQAVTPQMVANMAAGGAAINVLARQGGIELDIVDMGVAADLSCLLGVTDRKLAQGTGNIAREPAMSEAQCRRALQVGIDLARDAVDHGVHLLGTGDMGIANTTPSAALMCAWLGLPAACLVGRGTGVDDVRLAHKVATVERALARHGAAFGAAVSPLAVLASLGGYEIAGIAGLMLGAAVLRTPVVVDGFISSAGALAACRLCPVVKDYLFFSHLSDEAGHRAFAEALGVRPLLDLGMRLGEGTGAALAMHLVEAAVRIYNEMATFSSAGVSGRE